MDRVRARRAQGGPDAAAVRGCRAAPPAGPRRGRRRPGADDRLEGHEAGPRSGGWTFGFSRVSVYVDQYHCYLWDADWGPSFIDLSGYARGAAGSGSTATTGRSAQLAKRGVGHVSLDNGFRQVDDPALLDELTGSLGADEIRAYFARWIAQLPQPLTDDDRVAGYGYALSMLQVEVSDTRMFDRPIRARQWFEATITEQLTLGRPEKVSLDARRRDRHRSDAATAVAGGDVHRTRAALAAVDTTCRGCRRRLRRLWLRSQTCDPGERAAFRRPAQAGPTGGVAERARFPPGPDRPAVTHFITTRSIGLMSDREPESWTAD